MRALGALVLGNGVTAVGGMTGDSLSLLAVESRLALARPSVSEGNED